VRSLFLVRGISTRRLRDVSSRMVLLISLMVSQHPWDAEAQTYPGVERVQRIRVKTELNTIRRLKEICSPWFL
jgi:hypothetical protein